MWFGFMKAGARCAFGRRASFFLCFRHRCLVVCEMQARVACVMSANRELPQERMRSGRGGEMQDIGEGRYGGFDAAMRIDELRWEDGRRRRRSGTCAMENSEGPFCPWPDGRQYGKNIGHKSWKRKMIGILASDSPQLKRIGTCLMNMPVSGLLQSANREEKPKGTTLFLQYALPIQVNFVRTLWFVLLPTSNGDRLTSGNRASSLMRVRLHIAGSFDIEDETEVWQCQPVVSTCGRAPSSESSHFLG